MVRPFQFSNIVFTTFHYGEEWKKYIESVWDSGHVLYICGQLERSSDGNLHIQGYCELKSRRIMQSIKNLFKDDTLYIERRRGSQKQAVDYCNKVESRVEEAVSYGTARVQGKRIDWDKVVDVIEEGGTVQDIEESYPRAFIQYHKGIELLISRRDRRLKDAKVKEVNTRAELRPWQEEVVERLTQQNDRSILWVYDYGGNQGKSTLRRHLKATLGAFCMKPALEKDITHAYKEEEYIVVDLARSVKNVPYSLLEDFKDGEVFSPKYDSHFKSSIGCKIVVFSNKEPDYTAWTEDRYDVWTIKGNKLCRKDCVDSSSDVCDTVLRTGVDIDGYNSYGYN